MIDSIDEPRRRSSPDPAQMLVTFVLPWDRRNGLPSGVESFAFRAAAALASRRPCRVLLWGEGPGELDALRARGVVVEDFGAPPWTRRDAQEAFFRQPGVYLPNCTYGSYRAVLRAARRGVDLRIVAFAHSDDPEYYEWLRYYAEHVSRFVSVSEEIGDRFRALLPERAASHVVLPYGVPIPDDASRPYMPGGVLRITYAGRIVRLQKQVFRLLDIARELYRRRRPFLLRIIGSGTERDELEASIGQLPPDLRASVRLERPRSLAEMPAVWRETDAFILVSDYEGTSVAMLEAMAQGCVPFVTRTSGVDRALDRGRLGYAVEPTEAVRLGRILAEVSAEELASRGQAAARHIAGNFGEKAYFDRLDAVITAAAASPPLRLKWWQRGQPIKYSFPSVPRPGLRTWFRRQWGKKTI